MKYIFLMFFGFFLSQANLRAESLTLVHGFGKGPILEQFQALIQSYERESGNSVILKDTGGYGKMAAEADQHETADILHLSEFASLTAMEKLKSSQTYVPVSDILPELQGQEFLGGLHIYYGDENILYALPFNPSMGAVFYKVEAFRKAGIKYPLQTWEELWEACIKLKENGYVGFTFPWTAAYTYEFFVTLHNYYLASAENGFAGKAQFCLDEIPELANFFVMLFEAAQKGYFFHESDESIIAEKYFVNHPCAMLMQGAARLEGIQKLAKELQGKTIELAYGPLPYMGKLTHTPSVPKIGGGAFWVTAAGATKKGVKDFLKFMTRSGVQADWARKSGYLPTTYAAHKILVEQDYYLKHPEAKAAIDQVIGRPYGYVTHLRLPFYDKIRSQVFYPLFTRYLKMAQTESSLDLKSHALAFLQEFTKAANEIINTP